MAQPYKSTSTNPHIPGSPVSESTALESMNREISLRWYGNPRQDRLSTPRGSPIHATPSYLPTYGGSGHIEPELTLYPESKTKEAKIRLLDRLSWWWWWEVGSLFISAISLTTLLGVLARYQNCALSDWHLPLQPNSVISILTTTMKTTILLSVSACFGQLKWHHFTTPRLLSDLEAFDEASRGPWGSFLLLLRCRGRAPLAVGLAITTLATLLVEPITQQILDFPLSEKMLEGVNVKIVNSHEFRLRVPIDSNNVSYAKSFGTGGPLVDNTKALGIQNSLANAALGDISPFSFSCPESVNSAVECHYPNFTTLGICSSFHNTTDSSTQMCTHNHTSGEISCDISWSSAWAEIKDVQTITTRLNQAKPPRGDVEIWNYLPANQMAWDDVFSFLGRTVDSESSRGPILYLNGVRLPAQQLHNQDTPKFEGFECLWYWCAQEYSASVGSPRTVSPKLISTSLLRPTEPNCLGSHPEYCAYTDNSTSEIYHLDKFTASWLDHYIHSALGSSLAILRSPNGGSSGQSGVGLDIGLFLYSTQDLEMVFRNVATQASNIIRISGGENANTTAVEGVAFRAETFIEVRWGWVSLPVIETLLAIILLVATMMVTRKSQQPLLKSSANALLFHGLGGWTAADTARTVKGKETLGALDDISKSLEVRFQGNGRDGLQFVRI
ncbi:hypothetical protein F5X98DRAFT_378208 [Xylaria grammica]|nr:hypothetical protein F5X98DRAFT_378208 [Xylaria grammica]